VNERKYRLANVTGMVAAVKDFSDPKKRGSAAPRAAQETRT
jgi:hypothetical protein